mmetsp:Transcript_128490/g.410916  ORF Transcript_128490/g.410916 Transcript_128490/m.410916 type:complete len:322 (-) Transcript_128490:2079-3044(-)
MPLRLLGPVPHAIPGWRGRILCIAPAPFQHQVRRVVGLPKGFLKKFSSLLELLDGLVEFTGEVELHALFMQARPLTLLRPVRVLGSPLHDIVDVLGAGARTQDQEVHRPDDERLPLDARVRRLRDQHVCLVVLVHLLQVGGHVRILTHGTVLHSRFETHVPNEHLTRVDAATNRNLGQVPGDEPLIHRPQRRQHPHGRLDPRGGVVRIPNWSSIDAHDGIADELQHDASVLVNDLRHVVKVAAQQEQRLLRWQALDDGGERGDVGEEDRDLLLLHIDDCLCIRAQEQLNHGPGHVLAPRLDGLLQVLEGAPDDPGLARPGR